MAAGAAAMLAPVCLWGSSGAASEAVLGDDTAHACFEASVSTRIDSGAVHICDVALAGLLEPPERGAALVNRGVISLRRGDYAAAQSDFDTAILLIPQSGEAHFNRGAVFVAEHHYKELVADLDKAIELGVREPAKASTTAGSPTTISMTRPPPIRTTSKPRPWPRTGTCRSTSWNGSR